MRILAVTSVWPRPDSPDRVPFLVQHIERLRRSGLSVDVFAFEGRKNPLRYAAAWWSLRRHLRCRRYDLLHAHWGQSGLVALKQGLPVILTIRGSDLQGIVGTGFGPHIIQGGLLKQATRWVAPRVAAVVVVSARLARLLPGNLRTWVIPTGVDLEVFRPVDQAAARKTLALPPSTRLVLFASDPGRAEKRYPLAKAAVELARVRQDMELIVATDAPHSHMPLYYSACDALLLTSTHEGSPNVVKEALACGLPVVSTNVGDVTELTGRLDNCRVAADDTAATLADCLVTVLSKGRGEAGRVAAAAFGGDAETTRLSDLYVRVLRQHRPRQRGR